MILLDREWLSAGRSLGAAALLAAFAAPALAQPAPPGPAPMASTGAKPTDGPFTMTPVANGFLRLDTRTGQTSLCTVSGEQAQCRASADERAALEAEIARLARENSELKARQGTSGNPAPSTAQNEEDRRFDRNMDRAETFMRRMLRLFRDIQEKPASPSL